MSYRCGACGGTVPPGEARKVHVEYREVAQQFNPLVHDGREIPPPRKEIAREVPVCAGCLHMLQDGATLTQLRQALARKARKIVVANGGAYHPIALDPAKLAKELTSRPAAAYGKKRPRR